MSAFDDRNGELGRHERLCAYLFGELDEAGRARVEAELATDPELAAERARLEATIDLVRGAMPARETLTPAARAALTAAAGGGGHGAGASPIRPWPGRLARSPLAPLAAAAAVLCVLAGLAALAWNGGSAATRARGTRVARLEHEATAPTGVAERPAARRAPPAPTGASEAAAREALAVAEAVDAAEPAAADPAVPVAGPPAIPESPKAEPAPGAQEEPLLEPASGISDFPLNQQGGEAPLYTWRHTGGLTQAASEADDVDRAIQAELGLIEEADSDWFLGQGHIAADEADAAEGTGAKVQPMQKTAAAQEPSPTAARGRTYRGPGDSAPPSGTGGATGGPGSPGPTGPTTPGPGGHTGEAEPVFVSSSLSVAFQSLPFPAGPAGEPPLASPPTLDPKAPFLGQGVPRAEEPATLAAVLVRLEERKDAGGDVPSAGVLHDGEVARAPLQDLGYVGPADGRRAFAEGRATAAEREAWCDEIVRACRIRPRETPSAMFFRCWGDNPFELARLDPLSTFAADVDTASFALARAYLEGGHMPTKEQIRTEEFVNSFDSGVPAPVEEDFAIDLEMAPSLFGPPDAWMLRVVLRGREIDAAERPRLALTFVVDVSGSMQQGNRLELVKHALRLLVSQLDANDAIAIVAFSDEARLVLPMTSAGSRGIVESAIFGLHPEGSTNAEAGLLMGYEVAGAGLTPGANNRVVLLSDGVANVGRTGEDAMLANVAHQRAKGIYLNTIGVGMGNHNDALLEQLADKGDGICNYVDSAAEAQRVLVEGFTGAFVPLARDVKIQVEMDPAQVERYRLLGYENRAIADAQFRDDAVDAGEVGAGHQVTALYEIVRTPSPSNDGPLATVRVRYKPPFAVDSARTDAEAAAAAEVAREIARGIAFREVVTSFEGASAGYRRAVLVAQLAEVLRRSVHARGDSLDRLVLESARLAQADPDPAFGALARLVADRRDLIARHLPADDAIARALDELTRRNYLSGQLERLLEERRELSRDVIEELRRENADLEARIKALLLERLEER